MTATETPEAKDEVGFCEIVNPQVYKQTLCTFSGKLGNTVGELKIVDGQIVFTGDADESAKLFFELLIQMHAVNPVFTHKQS